MLVEVDHNEFKNRFTLKANPFLSLDFLALNKEKCDNLLYLVENKKKKIDLGLVVGLKNNSLYSPFSAPFGGFHFRHENIFSKEIDSFLNFLKDYIAINRIKDINITLPPDLYHSSLNAKMINALIRKGFSLNTPEIVSHVDLINFSGDFSNGNSRNNFRKAIKNQLSFMRIDSVKDKEIAFELIKENRQNLGRPIFMSFDDILNTEEIWPIDYFHAFDVDSKPVASAIFYRSHPKIIYGAFWGDNEEGRTLRAMDFLSYNIWNFYKNLNYSFIDLGTSTESGIPNEGLLRFKESHDSYSALRFSFAWSVS